MSLSNFYCQICIFQVGGQKNVNLSSIFFRLIIHAWDIGYLHNPHRNMLRMGPWTIMEAPRKEVYLVSYGGILKDDG